LAVITISPHECCDVRHATGDLASSDVVIAVVSEAAIQSSHVRTEIALAVDGKRPIIPVRIDRTDPQCVSDRIAALPWVALRAPDGVPGRRSTAPGHRGSASTFPDQRRSGDVADEAVAEDYRNRKGYDPRFLGAGLEVALPKVVGAGGGGRARFHGGPGGTRPSCATSISRW